MEIPRVFENLSLNKFYKYILYLAGIILILSLFIETKSIDITYVRKASFTFVVVGLILWICSDILDYIGNYCGMKEERGDLSDTDAESFAITLSIVWFILVIGCLAVGAFIAFS